MSDRLTPQAAAERALQMSKADEALVLVSESTEANLRWANNTLTTNGVARGRSVSVVSVVGGAASTVTHQGVLDAAGIEAVVRESEAAARAAAESGEAEDRTPLFGAEASTGDWDGAPAEASIHVFDRFAPDLGESLRRAEKSSELFYGFATYDLTTTYLATSSGLRSRHDQPTGHTEINAKSADLARSAWVGVPSNDFTDVDLSSIHDDLARRLRWAERKVDLPAGRYETILPPSAVADLMIYMYWQSSAREAYEGRTVFSRPGGGTRIGDRLSDAPLTLRSDPRAAGLDAAPFLVAPRSDESFSSFDNGAPLEPTAWISNGALSALVQTRFSAGLTGASFTPYIDNLILDAADPVGSIDHVVAGTERGLLLTCLWYIREVDPQTLLLTGLTRDGVYLVENGEVTGSVNNFRFNESPVDLLSRAVAAGETVRTLPREWNDYFTRTAMPALRVADFNMSSVSQAS